jgi:hypothetical protein
MTARPAANPARAIKLEACSKLTRRACPTNKVAANATNGTARAERACNLAASSTACFRKFAKAPFTVRLFPCVFFYLAFTSTDALATGHQSTASANIKFQ